MMPASAPMAEDRAYQNRILQGVSRTFALTIPVLPQGLCEVVGNAYLLCRIADTVEDDAELSAARQRDFSERFVRVVEGTECAERFSGDLHPLLAPDALDAERDLIINVPKVIRITHGFNANQRRALARCVRIMAKGMADYQMRESLDGLPDLPAMDEYCYFVAGVVGEMLTELFCDYSAEIAAHCDRLMPLAVSFGQGLQMTNILKDIWEDRRHGACWLPRDLFSRQGRAASRPRTREGRSWVFPGPVRADRDRPQAPGRCPFVHPAHPGARHRDTPVLPVGHRHGDPDAQEDQPPSRLHDRARGQDQPQERVGHRCRR